MRARFGSKKKGKGLMVRYGAKSKKGRVKGELGVEKIKRKGLTASLESK